MAVSLDVTLCAFTFRSSGDVQFHAFLEVCNCDYLSYFVGLAFARFELSEVFLCVNACFGEVTCERFVYSLFLLIFHPWTSHYTPNLTGLLCIAGVVVIGNLMAFPFYMAGVTMIGGTKKMVIFDDMKTMDKLSIFDQGIIETGEEYGPYEFKARSGDITIPYIAQEDALALMKELHVAPEAWAPLAEGKHGIFTHPLLSEIGSRYGKTPAQVALRWNVQRGVIILPKSTNPDRMKQNMDIFDFALTEEEMGQITALTLDHSEIINHFDPNLVRFLVTRKIHD